MERPTTGSALANDSSDSKSLAPTSVPVRRNVWLIVKWALTIVVVSFVCYRAVLLWRSSATGPLVLHWGWLILAGGLYTAGWLPSVWYFHRLLERMGDRISWPATMRAYYCGHLGKYVPGKALVPLIRGQMVAAAGGRLGVGALAVVYETLVMMGVGLELSVACFPFLIPERIDHDSFYLRQLLSVPGVTWLIRNPFVLPIATTAVVVATLPLVAWVFNLVAQKMVPLTEDQSAQGMRISGRFIGVGVVAFTIAWAIHGLALWATLRGVGVTVSLGQLPTWTICVAMPMTAGFLVLFSPGGVGVREGLLIEILRIQPGISTQEAVAAAFLLRAVGLIAEVVIAIVLYYGLARHSQPTHRRKQEAAHSDA